MRTYLIRAQIRLRRVCSIGKAVEFHTDYSRRTMQVPLNDESEYEGGRLVFATVQGFQVVPRPLGAVIMHHGRTVHGVTALTVGVRCAPCVVHVCYPC